MVEKEGSSCKERAKLRGSVGQCPKCLHATFLHPGSVSGSIIGCIPPRDFLFPVVHAQMQSRMAEPGGTQNC